MAFNAPAAAAAQNSNNSGRILSRERLRDRERLTGCDTQVESETCNERNERAYARLRASQGNITAAIRYRCIELGVVLNVGWLDQTEHRLAECTTS